MNSSLLRTSLRLLVPLTLLTLTAGAALGQAARDTRCANDARINNRPPRDCGAPVIVFFQGNAITVLQPSQGIAPGLPIFSVPRDGPIPTTANQVLAEAINPYNGQPVVLSRLTTGEFQLNTFFGDGTPYIIVWYQGFPDVYHLDPVTGRPLDGAQPIIAPGATNPGAGAAAKAAADQSGAAPSGETAATVLPGVLNNCRVTVLRTVRLREQPDTASRIIARLPYRTTYTATEYVPGWFRVVFENRQGWASASYLDPSPGCGL
ncbi:MAG: SH3 domain-containing protein [Aggregatilineales bacterium]